MGSYSNSKISCGYPMDTICCLTKSKPNFSYWGDLYSVNDENYRTDFKIIFNHTCKGIIHIESIEPNIFQMETSVNEYSER